MQVLQRSQPAFPMTVDMPEKRTHDYIRRGTTTLFAGLNVATNEVIAESHRKHRAEDFRNFLNIIDRQVPEELDTHKTAIIQRWLACHPRVHMHFTPTYSSWINQVERLFTEVTSEMLQRSDHRSVQSLEAGLRKWVRVWNERDCTAIGSELGVSRETLRNWVRQAEVDAGCAPEVTTEDNEEFARLREANEILKKATVFFAGELDPRNH